MNIFNLDNWTQETLQSIIDNSVEESTYLEFKSARALGKSDGVKDEIAKDVSAFANSDGGILIYGINEVNHKANCFDFINGDEYNKEWLELVITTAISRKIDGIKILPVRFNNDVNQTIYVLKIPVSYSAPHMVSRKKKYYKRYNFMAVEMEEYEVRQLYGRKEIAKLKFGIIRIGNPKDPGMVILPNHILTFSLSVKNIGNVVCSQYKIIVKMPYGNNYGFCSESIKNFTLTHLEKSHSISTGTCVSIFPNEEIEVMKFKVRSRHNLSFNDDVNLLVELYFDNAMTKKHIKIPIRGENSHIYRLDIKEKKTK